MKKTQIFTFVFNRPDLLQKQIDCFKKFFVGDYEINVVCDYRDDQYVETFKTICADNDVKFYPHKSKSNLSPSAYHGASVTWAYNEIMLKDCLDDYILTVDHDMFLIDKFNLLDYMKNYPVSGHLQERGDVKYVWPGLTMLDISKVKDIQFNFLPCFAEGEMLDTGGGTYALLKEFEFKPSGIEYPDFYNGIDLKDDALTGGFGFELLCDGVFLHSRNACNWHNGFIVQDSMKSNILYKMLSDIIDDNFKKYLEVVIARHEEDLSWASKYKEYTTIYNKGESDVEGSIKLKNIGREAHTYLHHIVNNYDNLADYTVFLQGDPINPHSPRIHLFLQHIIDRNKLQPFFWVSERIVESDFEYIREPYHKIFPNIKFAYETVFGEKPKVKTFTFGAGAQFCVSRERIRRRSKEFYQKILDIFEYDREELNEIALKLLGNPGINEKFLPLNPELGLQMERFWGFVFDEI